jgi:hypothetical protein
MLENVEKIFDGMQNMMKKLKKDSYQKNMMEFRSRNHIFLLEIVEYMEKAEEKEKAATEIADKFVNQIAKHFSNRGKIKGNIQVDLNFYMIYYVFPAILLTESEHAILLADAICSAWGSQFKESKIKYTDYDKLYASFHDKIFGIL